jgi:hypothetical protein
VQLNAVIIDLELKKIERINLIEEYNGEVWVTNIKLPI